MKKCIEIYRRDSYIVSLSNVIVLALKGYNENIVLIGASVFITVVGFVLLIAADNMQIRLTDKQIADAITSLEATVLEIRWLIGEMNSMKKRLSVYLEEGINQMVGDIPRPLFINKLNQVMWRTESKLLVAALIVLGGIYGMSNKSNNRKADAIAVLMENGEVDSYNNVLFYTAMMSRWIKEH
jgi:hypothetical protein